MARTQLVVLQDDLDGGTAEETVSFSLDGVDYEIDLSARNADRFRAEVDKFVRAARRTGGRSRRAGASTNGRANGGSAAKSRAHTAAIRDWARAQGLDVSDRGRIPGQIVAEYEAAH